MTISRREIIAFLSGEDLPPDILSEIHRALSDEKSDVTQVLVDLRTLAADADAPEVLPLIDQPEVKKDNKPRRSEPASTVDYNERKDDLYARVEQVFRFLSMGRGTGFPFSDHVRLSQVKLSSSDVEFGLFKIAEMYNVDSDALIAAMRRHGDILDMPFVMFVSYIRDFIMYGDRSLVGVAK